MREAEAAAMMRARFEAAGFAIETNVMLEHGDLRFEIDGYDRRHRVGYEYLTEEAGDSWDVDDAVVGELAARRRRGELFILIIDERDAPDEASVAGRVDAFLGELAANGVGPAAKPTAAKPTAKPKKPTAAKPTKPTAAKPTAAKPTAAKPTAKPKAKAKSKSAKRR